MDKLFGHLVKCEHCTGWIDTDVQDFAFEGDDFYHAYCYAEIVRGRECVSHTSTEE